MAVQSEFYKNPVQGEEEGETSYHPRVVNFQHVTTQRLAAEIHSATTFGKAEVEAMLMELSRCMATEPIHSMAAHADKVKFKSVSFLADRDLKGELIGMHAQRSKYKPHSATLSQEEIDKKLTGYFATHTVLTRSDMQSLCQFTHSMAARHIRRLKEEGSLQNIGIRTQPIYVPCPGHYGK